MNKTKTYTAKDIKQLSERDHVRLRTNVYLGNTHIVSYNIPIFENGKIELYEISFCPAVYKAVNEIIDNSLDEFAHINQKNKILSITAEEKNGHYIIEDNGRGIPIEMHESGKWTPEVALGSLRAGRNFTDDKEVGVIGQNGVGAACTNYCSAEFSVVVRQKNKRYVQKFTDGANKVSKPKIVHIVSNKSGTKIEFVLDSQVFKHIELPQKLVRNRAIEIALCNPDIVVEYNGERFKYKRGFQEIVKEIADTSYYTFTIDEPHIKGEFYIIFDVSHGLDAQMFTWVNSSLLFDGGLCNTQFLNAFMDKTVAHLEKDARKNKCEVNRNDVKENLLVLANLRITNPEYDAQAKTRLTGPNLRKEFGNMIEDQWKSFVRKSNTWLQKVLENATARHHFEINKKALKEHQTKLRRKHIDGLLDATSKVRSECQLLITEGDSASNQISEARDPKTTAAFSLMGKINNVHGASIAEVLKMGKLTDLLTVIGLVPGKKAVRSQLNYGRIVIATDADYDGADIFTLLVNLFYQFWPELFDKDYEPFIYRLTAPNVVVMKGNQRVHFTTRTDYEHKRNKYKGWSVEYMKGLGSMSRKDWKMILSGETNTNIPIVDDGNMSLTLELLFGNNADKRKEWLTNPLK